MKSYQLKTHKQQEVGEDLSEMEIRGITSSATSKKKKMKKNHRQLSDTFSASAHFQYCESTLLERTKSHRRCWTSPKAGCNLSKSLR